MMNDRIWVCSKSIDYNTGRVMDDFVDRITDENMWPSLLAHADVLKLYIEQVSKTPVSDLKRIADFVRKHDLKVAIEAGGIRMAPDGTPTEQIHQVAVENDFVKFQLKAFLEQGGRIDYITTDHSMAESITGRFDHYPGATMQDLMRQQALYFRWMQERIPGLRVGAIESLGFFWVKGAEQQYESTDPYLNRLDFEYYLTEYIRICNENGVKLDHFHIDFGLQDIEHDRGYGRVLAVEDFCHKNGVETGFICANAFHYPMYIPAEDEIKAAESSAERTVKYFEGYFEAGGRSDYLMFQRWQHYPPNVGSEKEPLSCLGILKSLLDRPCFKNLEK